MRVLRSDAPYRATQAGNLHNPGLRHIIGRDSDAILAARLGAMSNRAISSIFGAARFSAEAEACAIQFVRGGMTLIRPEQPC